MINSLYNHYPYPINYKGKTFPNVINAVLYHLTDDTDIQAALLNPDTLDDVGILSNFYFKFSDKGYIYLRELLTDLLTKKFADPQLRCKLVKVKEIKVRTKAGKFIPDYDRATQDTLLDLQSIYRNL